jgi:hypothetical protein
MLASKNRLSVRVSDQSITPLSLSQKFHFANFSILPRHFRISPQFSRSDRMNLNAGIRKSINHSRNSRRDETSIRNARISPSLYRSTHHAELMEEYANFMFLD